MPFLVLRQIIGTLVPKRDSASARIGRPARSSSGNDDAELSRSILAALEEYLGGRRLLRVKIRHGEGNNTEGFLKIDAGKEGLLLVDFKAMVTPRGELSSLEVGGRKIRRIVGSQTRRTS